MPDSVDLSKFKRKTMVAGGQAVVSASYSRYTLQADVQTLAQLGYGWDGRAVPVHALQSMGTCPAVYLAERTVTGIVRRPDLFSIRHPDKAVEAKLRAEIEAWLWPLLPKITAAAARAFAYGTVAVVFDWERKTLKVRVPKDGGKARKKTLERHTHYGKVFEIHPDATQLRVDEQSTVTHVQTLVASYPMTRAHAWEWDPEFDEHVGQGARRRAWSSYCEWLIVRLLRDKYLERSVDSPRVAYAPGGKVEVDGVTYEKVDYVLKLLQDLRGSGEVGLPSDRDKEGNKQYEIDVLEIPDRAEVWDQALNRIEADIYAAYLVSALGGLDDAGGAASRTLEGMLKEHVEDLANWIAQGLTELVEHVHVANYDPEEVEAPEVYATDVGKREARKNLMDVLRLVNQAGRGEASMRADVPKLLDKIGVPLRDEPPVFPPGWGGQSGGEPGRQKEDSSDRQRRRDEADTEEGEDDTGGPRDEDGDPEPTEGQG